jgi:hypothetical protein
MEHIAANVRTSLGCNMRASTVSSAGVKKSFLEYTPRWRRASSYRLIDLGRATDATTSQSLAHSSYHHTLEMEDSVSTAREFRPWA